jgi:hypothetical protein
MARINILNTPTDPPSLLAALNSPQVLNMTVKKEDTFDVIWDSGASMCVTPDRNDFVGPLTNAPIGLKLQGLAKGIRIQAVGHVLWSIVDSYGRLRHLKLPAYHTPDAPCRLLSTTVLLQTYSPERLDVTAESMTLLGKAGDPQRGPIVAKVSPLNNLPTTTCYRYDGVTQASANLAKDINAVHQLNANLTEPEKELLRWHQRLGHVSFRVVQFLLRMGVLSHSVNNKKLHTAASNLSHPPKCAACQFGKQHSRPVPGKRSKIIQDAPKFAPQDPGQPGQRIFVDHFVCSTKGRKLSGYGVKNPNDPTLYTGGCLFIDDCSGFVDVELQCHLNTHDTLAAVEAFEKKARDAGVIPQSYQTDNGSAFTSRGFLSHLAKFSQTVRHSGAGSHHQNGRAERAIQTIMAIARTMMLHAAIHWPAVADPTIWPMAVSHAVWLWNHLPKVDTGLSPHDIWTRTRWPLRELHNLHVFGCPTYVLQKKLADGQKTNRWEPRSDRMINVGLSSLHANSVPLVLNPSTGSITPQWNIIFDDWFATVTSSPDDLLDFNEAEWAQLFGVSTYHHPFDSDDLQSMDDVPVHPSDTARVVGDLQDIHVPPIPLAPPASAPPASEPSAVSQDSASIIPPLAPSVPSPQQREPQLPLERERHITPDQREDNTPPEAPAPLAAPLPPAPTKLPSASPQPQSPRRSKRIKTEIVRTTASSLGHLTDDAAYLVSTTAGFNAMDLPQPYAYQATKQKDPDTLTWDQAMSDSNHADDWKAAALKEIRELEAKGCWEEVPKTSAEGKIIPVVWVFRRKRSPDGQFRKFKARFCVRGDLMADDIETFAPVVSWATVRTFLVIAMTLGWATVSVDWANAFVQATLAAPIWIHVPRGFSSSFGINYCLKLKRSLYGTNIAPRLWWQHLRSALLNALGMTESAHDPCLLYRPGLIMVLYVDDAGIAAPVRADIEFFVKQLKDLEFDVEIEDNFNEYLGIKIDDLPSGAKKMSQKGLIQKTLKAAKMEDCNPNWVPAAQASLGTDPDGEDHDQSKWHYSSIVGMLLYIANNTRPDISFAVSSVARFVNSPKKSHASAVQTILRYLKRTEEMGIIVKPNGTFDLKVWVDADFAGLYGREPSNSSNSARSRLGYLVTLGGVLLTWRTNLIQEICLSTLEAEYVALVNSVRAVIPIRNLILDLLNFMNLAPANNPVLQCTVFEDNQGAYLLATNQRLSARTKYFTVKWHFFWSHVYHPDRNPNGWLIVEKCSTDMQDADYLTKGLPREVFEKNRQRVQGW